MKQGLDLDVAPLNESISQTPSALLVPYSGDGFSSAFFLVPLWPRSVSLLNLRISPWFIHPTTLLEETLSPYSQQQKSTTPRDSIYFLALKNTGLQQL